MKYLRIYILIFIILLTNAKLFAQYELKFKRYNEKQGLEDSWIHSITQDTIGFIWVGAGYGLFKFDSNNFTGYFNDQKDTNSISDNFVKFVFCDSKGKLWIGHRKGFSLYNPEKDNFKNFHFDFYSNFIREDVNGIFWISTNKGLAKFDPLTQSLDTYFYNENDTNTLSYSNSAMNFEDSQGRFWVATDLGLNLFDKNSGEFSDFNEIETGVNYVVEDKYKNLWIGTRTGLIKYNNGIIEKYFNDISILKLYFDFDGNLWVGTYSIGIYYIDFIHSKTFNFISDDTQSSSLSNNKVCDFFISDDKILWIATYGGGVCSFDFNTLNFKYFRYNSNLNNTLASNDVFSFYIDQTQNLWVATFDSGLNLFDSDFNIKKTFANNPESSNSVTNNTIYSVTGDNKNIYLAVFGGGLDIYDLKTKTFSHFKSDSENSKTISDNEASCLLKDTNNILWVGTMKGLNIFDLKTSEFTRFFNQPSDSTSLSNDNVWIIFKDKFQNIWIGTKEGLNLYDYNTKKFKQIKNIDGDTTSLINNHVWSIFQDSKNRLWIGTMGGLCLYDYQSQKFKSYTEDDGLSNNVVFGILEDSKGNLWLSTNKYLNKFNPESGEFKWFDENDGLQGNEFNPGSSYKDSNGNLYFGGTNGFNVFNPDSINEIKYNPKVVLTKFLLFNEPVEIGEKTVLKKSLNYTSEIELNYDDYIFAFEFTALNYRNPEKTKYAYMLEGFNDDWIYTGYNDRKAVFTSVPSGEYNFIVKASNEENVWTENPLSISIIINPPWWQEWWAIIIWISAIAGSLISIYFIRVSSLTRQKKLLEIKVKERTLEILKQKEEIGAQAEELEVINAELEKFSIAVSQTDNAIIIMDAEGNFEWINEGFTKLYGYTFAEYLHKSKNIFDEISKEEIRNQIKESIKNKQTFIYEDLMISKSGESINIQTTITPIINSLGNVERIIAIDADIRILKKIEKELKVKNQLVTDSINYSKTIQNAILPLKETIDENFKSFIIFRPKDIISGDFYWYHKFGNRHFFAVADCTGHGVPAALLSMIGNTLFNEIIISLKITETSEILEMLHKMLVESLRLDKTDINEGMDVCLIRIDKNEINEIQYSGAKRQLLVYDSEKNLIDIKQSNRRSIGGGIYSVVSKIPFTYEIFNINPKDRIYMFSDGFTDQNNKDRKKFGMTKLIDILISSSQNTIEFQGEKLENELEIWMNGELQRDDITFLGIEF